MLSMEVLSEVDRKKYTLGFRRKEYDVIVAPLAMQEQCELFVFG